MARSATLGVDFGTSNSAAGYMEGGAVRLVEMAPGRMTLPTAFFFDYDTRETLVGDAANAALLEGAEGRFMRALKRVLGTELMHEERRILNRSMTFVEIIGGFLAGMRERAQAQAGRRFDRALAGRPVVFHGADDPREARAEADLRACYRAAGFDAVEFMPEPEAAAIASGAGEGIGVIVDVGGGTADFSLFEAGEGGISILANHGVRIGGTDFDRAISIDRVMPLLGKGTELRRLMGPGSTPTPNALFNDLATWEMIPFLYTAANRRMVAEMVRLSREPGKLSRLATVLEDELGHELAFAVERGKMAANESGAGAAPPAIALDAVERGLACPLPAEALTRILAPHARALDAGARETLRRAALDPARVERVIYVGGSSLMAMVSDTMAGHFPDARHSLANVFTAVTDGLAMAAGEGEEG